MYSLLEAMEPLEFENEEEENLKKMGYTQELHRGFNAIMSFSFCFTAVAVISSVSGLFSTAMATGGPVVIIWSWLIGSLFSVVIALSMAEIVSTYPSAGRERIHSPSLSLKPLVFLQSFCVLSLMGCHMSQ